MRSKHTGYFVQGVRDLSTFEGRHETEERGGRAAHARMCGHRWWEEGGVLEGEEARGIRPQNFNSHKRAGAPPLSCFVAVVGIAG